MKPGMRAEAEQKPRIDRLANYNTTMQLVRPPHLRTYLLLVRTPLPR